MNENKNNLFSVEMSAHLPLDIQPAIGKDWTLNGPNNSNYRMILDSVDDSPTNASIINGYHAYILGEGLIDENSENENDAITNVSKHLSKQDVSQIVLDYYTYGGFATQQIWNSATKPEDKKPILIKYFKVFKLGLNLDDQMECNGYWYSWDWYNHGKYVPKFYPKYTGKYNGNDVELLITQRPSNKDFFSGPSWISGLRYAQNEGNLQNWSYNHILNGFQGTKLININTGKPATEELARNAVNQIKSNLQGTNNANKYWVSFNDKPELAPTIVDIPITELNAQYQQFAVEAREMLIAAHGASPIIFANTQGGNGLSTAADEIEMATAMQFRKNINGIREGIINGLQAIFNDINPNVKLGFKDWPTFDKDKREDVAGDNNEQQIITE